jgi:hypothetical protein
MKEDKLLAFIKAHREEFDIYTPSPELLVRIKKELEKRRKAKEALTKDAN